MSEKPFLRVRVSRAATVPSGQDAWEKAEYAIEADVPTGMTATDAIRELEGNLEQTIGEFQKRLKAPQIPETPKVAGPPPPLPPGYQTAASVATQLPVSAEPTPELSPSYLDGLPWRSETWGQWIFSDTPGAKALSEAVAKETVLTIGNYQYKISKGRDKDFINRFQAKKP